MMLRLRTGISMSVHSPLRFLVHFGCLILASAGLAACEVATREGDSASPTVQASERLAQPVVILRNGLQAGSGYGVVIGDVLLTAAHVVLAGDQILVKGPRGWLSSLGVVADDAIADVVALRLDRSGSVVSDVQIAPEEPRVGAELILRIPGKDAVNGFVMARLTHPLAGYCLVSDIPVQFGHSGSPVWDADGKLLGIVTRASNVNRQRASSFSYIAPPSTVAALMLRSQSATPMSLCEWRGRHGTPSALDGYVAAVDRLSEADNAGAIAILKRSLADSPHFDAARRLLVSVCLEVGQYDLVRDAAAHWNGSPSEDAVRSFLIGYAYMEEQDPSKAIGHLLRSIECVPTIPAWYELARAYSTLGDAPASLTAIQSALAMEPADSRVLVLATQLYLKAGQPDNAMQSANTLAGISDTDAATLLCAQAALAGGLDSTALDLLMKRATTCRSPVAFASRAVELLRQFGHRAQAVTLLGHMRVNAKDRSHIELLLGRLSIEVADFERSLGHFQAAMRDARLRDQAVEGIVLSLCGLARFEEAREQLEAITPGSDTREWLEAIIDDRKKAMRSK